MAQGPYLLGKQVIPALWIGEGGNLFPQQVWLTTEWKKMFGHASSVKSLRFSDDGGLLASGGDNGAIVVWDVASGSRLHWLGRHDSGKNILAFSEDNAHLTTRTSNECFVWELKSGELLERRDHDMSDKKADMILTRLDHLDGKDRGGWQTVVGLWDQRKKCKDALFRLPREYGIAQRYGPIFGDRAVLFYSDGRVLILDISRVMNVYMDRARQIEWRLAPVDIYTLSRS